jgi:hypothetical protein
VSRMVHEGGAIHAPCCARERPCRHRAAEQCHELAASNSITSSASAASAGISRYHDDLHRRGCGRAVSRGLVKA